MAVSAMCYAARPIIKPYVCASRFTFQYFFNIILATERDILMLMEAFENHRFDLTCSDTVWQQKPFTWTEFGAILLTIPLMAKCSPLFINI